MENRTEAGESGGFLSGLRGLLTREAGKEAPERPYSGFDSVRDEFNAAIKSLQERADTQRALHARRQAGAQAAATVGIAGVDRRAQLEEELGSSKRAMLADIESLHQRLKSGVDPSRLSELNEFLLSVSEEIEQGKGANIEERLRATALITVFRRSGEIAWDELNRLMNASGEAWPEPHEISRNATQEEMSLARERSIAEVRELFLELGPERIAELVLGVVSAWTLSYPKQGTWLWRQVSLRGVAAGIQAQITKEVVRELRSEGEAIKKDIARLMSKELTAINSAAIATSIEEADRLVRTTSAALEGLVENLILERAAPVFERFVKK